MIIEQKEIRYKGRIIFERLVMSKNFQRVPKIFEEDEACFLFLTKGAFKFRTPGHLLVFNEGEAMLAKCGNYLIENIGINKETEHQQMSVVGVFFYPSMVKGFFETDLSLEGFRQNFDVKKVDVEPLLGTYLDSVNFILDNPDIADDNLVITKLKELLILLSKSENSISVSEFVNDLFTPHIHSFKEIIQQNLYTNLSMPDLAYLCNMSLATFKRKIPKIYGQSPAKYFLTKKLERAHHLIQLEGNTIANISYECGFESVSSFNRAYKKHYGKTPTAFRLGQKGN